MSYNGKRSPDSASKSLLNTSSSLQMLLYECNTARSMPLLRVCNRFSHYCGGLGKEKNRRWDSWFAHLATCRCGTSAMLSDIANSLVTDENTGERQVWLIKAYDYI